jgi:hypothetical protein
MAETKMVSAIDRHQDWSNSKRNELETGPTREMVKTMSHFASGRPNVVHSNASNNLIFGTTQMNSASKPPISSSHPTN